ncbi:RNA polymerase II subunit 7 [Eremomyces bilateralis CBS 781.70]|uniref:DNA-directed RNA polymerase subunit n=1 Tax=Eremomyces bilateralis CBS 781.70 TaxID=1392243 RepID=A0A6G1FY25_9PEZI|nr:RNA polymerase II subunit 7 [Eremomyces bilateralis CBS 781.70]KAF1810674.1 RNA polymerase II subunit 7 [Eremomyces bilateralis CBS 781.70]
MFFIHDMERTITLHPSYMGPHVKDILLHRLHADVEGANMGNFYVVLIMDTGYEVSEGRIMPGTGFAEYTVHYRAVVWRPFRGEIVDGVVNSVVDGGFFVNVGPLSVFVAKSMIPGEIKFDGNATPPQWTDNGDQIIEKDTKIRIKIKGLRVEMGTMYAIATIKEDYLGPLP